MSMEVGAIRFRVGLENKEQFTKETRQLSQDVESKLGGSFEKLGQTIAATFSIAAIVAFSNACYEAYATSVEMSTKLETIMRQRLRAEDEEIEKIKNLHSELQAIGVVEDDIAAAGTQQLATFLKETESLEILIPAMQNLVAQQKGYNASAGDSVNIGNLMGKVMQGQTAALRRVGVSFTEAQEQVLKYGNEIEKATVLSQVITDNVGNMNEALGATPIGKIKQFSNAWGDLMENIGGIITNVISPVISGLNVILERLLEITSVAKNLSDEIFGANINIQSNVGSIEDLAEATGELEEAASKTQFAFDNLNILGGEENANIGGLGSITQKDIENIQEVKEETSKIQKIINDFVDRFKDGFDDATPRVKENLNKIQDSVEEIGKTIIGIFGSQEVVNATKDFSNVTIESLGNIAGSILQLGTDAGVGFAEGVNRSLDKNKYKIQDGIVDTLRINEDTINRLGDTSIAISEIFSPIGGENGIKIWEELMDIISTISIYTIKIASNLANNISKITLEPLIGNSEGLRDIFDDILERLGVYLEDISKWVDKTSLKLDELSQGHFTPLIDKITQGNSELLQSFTETYETKLKPILSEFGESWTNMWEEHIGPSSEEMMDAFGELSDSLGILYEEVLKPFVEFVIEYGLPLMLNSISGLFTFVTSCIGGIIDFISHLIQALTSLIEFLVGIFTLDWEMVWTGLVGVVENVVSAILDLVLGLGEGIIEGIANALDLDSSSGPSSRSNRSRISDFESIKGFADGGIFKPNNPHFVKVGDNTKEEEYISPASKIEEAAYKGFKRAVGGSSTTQNQTIENYIYLSNRQIAEFTNEVNKRDSKVKG